MSDAPSRGGSGGRALRADVSLPALALVCVSAGSAPADAQEHRVVRVSAPHVERPAEVSVALDPRDPDRIVAVSLAAGPEDGPRITDVVHASRDGGRSWRSLPAPNPAARVQGDDAIVFDARGVAYRSYISFRGLREERPERAANGVFVSRSTDAGLSWSEPVPVVDHLNTLRPFEDKPWIAADRAPASPHRGNLYVAWTRFDVYGSESPHDSSYIWFSRSVDSGRSFELPVRVSDAGGDARDSDDTVEGAVPAVGPEGRVYLAWAGPRGIVFDRSSDGGESFGRDAVIAENPGGWDIDVEGVGRHNGMPVTAADLSDGPNRGSVYVAWIDERHGDPDVFVARSRDGGDSWSDPVRVNADPVGNARPQMFAWMAVDPADGSVNLVFHDRSGLEGTRTAVTVARSVDGGRSFVNRRIGVPPFETDPEIFFGDYSGIDALRGRVVAVFPRFAPTGESERELLLTAALFRFRPGTQEIVPAGTGPPAGEY